MIQILTNQNSYHIIKMQKVALPIDGYALITMFTEINRYFWTRGGYFFLYARTATNTVTSPIITSAKVNRFSYVTYCILSPPYEGKECNRLPHW